MESKHGAILQSTTPLNRAVVEQGTCPGRLVAGREKRHQGHLVPAVVEAEPAAYDCCTRRHRLRRSIGAGGLLHYVRAEQVRDNHLRGDAGRAAAGMWDPWGYSTGASHDAAASCSTTGLLPHLLHNGRRAASHAGIQACRQASGWASKPPEAIVLAPCEQHQQQHGH